MNRSDKGKPIINTLDGWGTDLDTRRLKIYSHQISELTATVENLNSEITQMEETNALSDLESQYNALMVNERYVSDRRGYQLR